MSKRKQKEKNTKINDELSLKEIDDKDDLSDSDESVYSGLEEEQDSESEEEEIRSSDDENGDEEDITKGEVSENNEFENDQDSKSDGGESSCDDNDDEDDGLSVNLLKNTNSDLVNTSIRDKDQVIKSKALFEDVDTSDEEDIRNTVGNIPMKWYDEYDHIGYNLSGSKIMKKIQGDQLDEFLAKMDDPDYGRTVYDKLNMEDIKLSDEEIAIIQRMQGGQFPEKDFDQYEPYVDYFTGDKMVHPIKDNPASKSSFIPSKWEHKRVIKIVRAIRNGWIKPKQSSDGKPKYYLLWGKDDISNSHPMHWPAPKLKLPGHEESYNPPPEYLPTDEERSAWEALDLEDRPQNFLSKKYDALRKVPGYSNFIQEKFERCLDLYLCPRQRKIRLQVDPEDLIPKLPRPKDLQPFPTTESLIYKGHEEDVRCISVDSSGQWLASGSSDNTIRFWEVSTGRCMKTIKVDGTVNSLQWNPLETAPIVAAAVDNIVLIINPGLGDKLLCKNIDNQVNSFEQDEQGNDNNLVKWSTVSKEEYKNCIRLKIEHQKAIKQVTWHLKGDYFSTLLPEAESKAVIIHQFSKRKSQCPFKKSKGQIQCVKFHPKRPFFFVATQRYVRVYNLQKQELTKKLMSGVKWISSMDVHPQGDNIIIGSYDKRLCWFDMDLSSKPYKTLRHHKKALRQVVYHRCYPLFASASDDGNVIICHGTVYSDLMQNPLIVPLKILRGHKITKELGAIDCVFHPHQPWIFTAGADKTIRLFT